MPLGRSKFMFRLLGEACTGLIWIVVVGISCSGLCWKEQSVCQTLVAFASVIVDVLNPHNAS